MNRGQAALEFLMTYGWAIMVVLVAIASLAYFGVLSPDRYFPEQCMLPSGFPCLDITYVSTGIQLLVQNAAGKDFSSVLLSISGPGCSDIATGPDTLLNDKKGIYEVNCGPPEGKFKATLTINYTNTMSGLAHSSEGSLVLKVPETAFTPTPPPPPQNGTQSGTPNSAVVYKQPGHTQDDDVTNRMQLVDTLEKHINKNEEALHVVFNTTLTNGDKVNIYVTPCHKAGEIQIQEEGFGNVVGTGSCAKNVNQWVNMTLSNVVSASTTWDLVGTEDTDFNYVEYVK